jgi:hypothetical protein
MFPSQVQRNQTLCKCCGSKAGLYDVCDFSKNCEEKNGKFLSLSGIPIYYYKCTSCGFVFTTQFDNCTEDEFKKYIYNDEYPAIDPEYLYKRPKNNADAAAKVFARQKNDLRILDYGGGNGLFEKNLKADGFSEVESYDPFCREYSNRPRGRFNLVLSFEVVEHLPDPHDMFKDMLSFLDSGNGLIMFSTLIQPSDIDKLKTFWWYISPRNGHVSIYTNNSLKAVLSTLGLNYASAGRNLHLAFRNKPDFAQHIFCQAKSWPNIR